MYPAFTQVLQNELLLKKVATNLGPCDLKALRRTSSQWNRHFTRFLKTRHSPFQLMCEEEGPGHHLNLETLMYLLGPPGNELPFSSYEIHESGSNHNLELEFFERFGPTMKKLKLWSSFQWRQCGGLRNTRRIVFELTPELEDLCLCFADLQVPEEQLAPNERSRQGPASPAGKNLLPRLKGIHIIANAQGEHPDDAELITDLLECAVGLESLSVIEWDEGFDLKIVTAVRDRTPHLDNIKSFTLFGVNTAKLRLLVDLGLRLQLKEFRVAIEFPNFHPAEDVEAVQLLYSFLETQTGTLEDLLIDIVWWLQAKRPKIGVWVPLMPRVRNLQWGQGSDKTRGPSGNPDWDRGEQKQFSLEFEGGSLQRCFPALRRLSCTFEEWSTDLYEVGQELRAMAHTGVHELGLDVSREIGKVTAQALASLWPAVTKLEVELKPEHLNLFADAWPRLEILQIRVAVKEIDTNGQQKVLVLDELLSGVPISEHSTLEGKTELWGPHSRKIGTLRAMLTKYKTEPGLSDFTHLKKFVFEAKSIPVYVDNVGGFFGIALASPTLQHVSIKGAWVWMGREGEKEMGAACAELIRTKFGKTAILNLRELKYL